MGELVQANLELHEELEKEVRINLENEAKIKRLERQQARYEEDIQYLYGIITKLESQKACDKEELHSLRVQLTESHKRLKNSEKLCDEKEQFILFRESQLLESEDVIYKLKRQIHKMASSSTSDTGPTTTPHITANTITTLCGDIRRSLAVFYGSRGLRLPTRDEVQIAVDNITNYQGQIESHSGNLELAYAQARIDCQQAKDDLEKKLLELADCVREKDIEKDTYEKALKECKEEFNTLKEMSLQEIEEYKTKLFRYDQSLQGAFNEISEKDIEMAERKHEIDRWVMGYDELGEQLKIANRRYRELENDLGQLQNESGGLIRSYEELNQLSIELQRNLEQAGRGIAERDILINQRNIQLANCRNERNIISAYYRAEQTVNRSLVRQKLALKIANRQLQIRLMNPPIIIPPPPPQQIDQIWLLLQ